MQQAVSGKSFITLSLLCHPMFPLVVLSCARQSSCVPESLPAAQFSASGALVVSGIDREVGDRTGLYWDFSELQRYYKRHGLYDEIELRPWGDHYCVPICCDTQSNLALEITV